jgi:hypothetical protein
VGSSLGKWCFIQIVGFTASVGVGRTSTEQGAEEHIQRMMANLDAEELVTVKRCLPELLLCIPNDYLLQKYNVHLKVIYSKNTMQG